jgi:hypothetical protein
MRNRITLNGPDVINYQGINNYINAGNKTTELFENNPVSEILATEGGESFYNYVEWLGLAKDPNLVVLSSVHHYYYEEEDLNDVSTVINLKQLNHIKSLSAFFHSIFKIIPPKSNFIGCFAEYKRNSNILSDNSKNSDDSKTISDALENGIISRNPFLNMIYNIMDSKTNRFLTRRDVYQLFEKHSYRILDLTELNGLTYFLAQKVRVTIE